MAGGSDCGPVTVRERGKGEGTGREGGREVNLLYASMVYSTTPLTKAHPEIQPATSTLCLLWFHKKHLQHTTGCFCRMSVQRPELTRWSSRGRDRDSSGWWK